MRDGYERFEEFWSHFPSWEDPLPGRFRGHEVTHGRWGAALGVLGTVTLPMNVQHDLYEQVILELLEAGERNTNPRNPLHFDSVEGRRNCVSGGQTT